MKPRIAEAKNNIVLNPTDDLQTNPFDNQIILADKPKGWTSANVLNVLKKRLGIKKAGHAGTLDPMASGLLVICTGTKTKIISEFIDYGKVYEGTIRIGAKTESFDTETEEYGEVNTSHISENDLENSRNSFMGEILQIPPMHSALKHKGKPLYELARKGKEVVREPRRVKIDEFHIKRLTETEVFFKIACSKGTYIRSIANDFGNALNVGGYLKDLRRIVVGDFKLGDFQMEEKGIKFEVYPE